MSAVSFVNVHKAYSNSQDSGGVFGVSFEVPEGRFTTLLGPSGSGKTTVLRLLAGFLRPTDGEVRIGTEVVAAADRFVPPNARDLAMVFQSYALWPHLTVFDNVAFGLRARKVAKSTLAVRVDEALQQVGLELYARRRPGELSGGQQQRVALARSLVLRPRLLLLDEPLSNLDADRRVQMRTQLKDLQASTKITFVYVTHDQDEAFALSDHLLVLEEGRVIQQGTPQDLYNRPTSVSVARFLTRGGLILEGVIGNRLGKRIAFTATCASGVHSVEAMAPSTPTQLGSHGHVVVHPESLQVLTDGEPVAQGFCSVPGTVRAVNFAGRENHLEVALDVGTVVSCYDNSRRATTPGDVVRVAFHPDHARVVTRDQAPPSASAPSSAATIPEGATSR